MNFVSEIIKDKAAKVHQHSVVGTTRSHQNSNDSPNQNEMDTLLQFAKILETLRDVNMSSSRLSSSEEINEVRTHLLEKRQLKIN